MKNRKTIIVAFVLVACMLVGVGYAVVFNTMDIGGTASVSREEAEKAFNQDIYFSGVVVDGTLDADGVVAGDNKGYTANINTNNNDKAQFTVTGLATQGDSVDITFRIENEGDLDADLIAVSHTISNTTYFDVKYYVVGGSVIDVNDTAHNFYTLNAKANPSDPNTYVDIKVVVTLLATPTDHQSLTTTFEFNATSDDTP